MGMTAEGGGGIPTNENFLLNGIPQSPPGGGDSPLLQGGLGGGGTPQGGFISA